MPVPVHVTVADPGKNKGVRKVNLPEPPVAIGSEHPDSVGGSLESSTLPDREEHATRTGLELLPFAKAGVVIAKAPTIAARNTEARERCQDGFIGTPFTPTRPSRVVREKRTPSTRKTAAGPATPQYRDLTPNAGTGATISAGTCATR